MVWGSGKVRLGGDVRLWYREVCRLCGEVVWWCGVFGTSVERMYAS